MSLIASCHCGATRIELPQPPATAKSCNCRFCARAGAVWAYYKPGEVRLLSQEDERTYSASGGLNRHHFCGRCGMHTWGASPDWASAYNADGTPKEGFTAGSVPSEEIWGVNLNMVDDLDWSAVGVEKVDGRTSW